MNSRDLNVAMIFAPIGAGLVWVVLPHSVLRCAHCNNGDPLEHFLSRITSSGEISVHSIERCHVYPGHSLECDALDPHEALVSISKELECIGINVTCVF